MTATGLTPGALEDLSPGETDEGPVQLLTPEGRVLASSPPVLESLGVPDLLRRALTGSILVQRPIPELQGTWRLLALPVATNRGQVILVVGACLTERDEALEHFGTQLALGGLLALVLACLAGYGLASSAFRPVEELRRRAATIGAHPGERLSPLLPIQIRRMSRLPKAVTRIAQ